MTQLLLVRHAEAPAGGAARHQALTDRGLAQANALAARLRSLPIVEVWSSPLPRATATAEPVARALGLPCKIDPDLRELEVTDFTPTQAAAVTARLRAGIWTEEEAEPAQQLAARVQAALDRIRVAGDAVVVVCHGAVINAALCAVFGVPFRLVTYLLHTSVTQFVYDNAGVEFGVVNDAHHLGDQLRASPVQLEHAMTTFAPLG